MMLEPPWRDQKADLIHWLIWALSWAYAISGLVLGAFVGPLLAQKWGLANTSYEDPFIIGVGVLVGFLAQNFGWLSAGSAVLNIRNLSDIAGGMRFIGLLLGVFILVVWCLFPFVWIGQAFHIYFTQVGVSQRSITIAFVGALLVKTLLIPFIKSIVTGSALGLLRKWLRGNKPQTSKP